MTHPKYFLFSVSILFCSYLPAQDFTRVVVVDTLVGPVIDSAEKAKYHLFTFWKKENFKEASFYMKSDSSLVLVARLKNDSMAYVGCVRRDLQNTRITINAWAGNYKPQTVNWFEVLVAIGQGVLESRNQNIYLRK